MQDTTMEKSLFLSAEEALGLLDTVMLSPRDLSPDQHAAVIKLSAFCREFLRESCCGVAAVAYQGSPAASRPA